MKNTNVEYRTTKEIVENIVRNSSEYSGYNYKTIFYDNKMFYCVKAFNSKDIYEVKITRKVREEDRIVPDNNHNNKDEEKQIFLYHLVIILKYIFKKVVFHEGNILIIDNNNDYIISLVKKSSLKWE